MKINIITLGCSKNTSDSEHLAGHWAKAGLKVYFDRTHNDCDTVIVNTCGFIGDAKEESVNVLVEQCKAKADFNRRHKRDGKCRKLIAIGCLVERYRDELAQELPEVDEWYGTHEWETILGLHDGDFESRRLQSTPKHYAYLKIAEGCDRHCSYCAIPLIRGRHVSRPMDDIVQEAKQMTQNGVKELIIIAQDTTYYGLDLYGERRLADLMERLAQESGAQWIRLHYTYPSNFPMEVLDVMQRHDNICKYIDIPLQHIDSKILASMHRGIDKEGTIALLDQIRAKLPDVSIRTTLIVGYPGESAEAYERLKQFVAKARFDRLGVFAYSPEENTDAYRLGDPVDEEEKNRRVSELMAIQEQISLENNQRKAGKTLKVIIDRREGNYLVGRTEYDSPEVDDEVLIKTKCDTRAKPGDFCIVKITDAFENDIIGTIVEPRSKKQQQRNKKHTE